MSRAQHLDVVGLSEAIDETEAPARIELRPWGSGSPASMVRALQSAIDHETALRELAASSALDSERLFRVFLTTLRRALLAEPDPDGLSEGDEIALREAGVDLTGSPVGAPDAVIATSARLAHLVSESLTTAECAHRTGLTPARIRQRIAAGTVYVLPRDTGEWRLPTWQIVDGGFLPGLDHVAPHIGSALHPLTVEALMTRPDPDLEVGGRAVSPIEWLATGGPPEVVADLLLEAPGAP